MKHTISSLWCALALFAALWMAPVLAADAPATAISSAQATHVLDLLRDDKRRAELEQTLATIAEASAPAPAAADEAEAASKPLALEADGVIAQVLSRAGQWLDSAASETRLIGQTMLDFHSAQGWWTRYFGTAEARAAMFEASWALLLILFLALVAEWGVHRLLRRPRSIVLEHSARRYAADEAQDIAQAPLPLAAVPDNSAGRIGAEEDGATGPVAPDRHWKLLRRFPFALANAILDLLPLLGFLAVTTVLAAFFGGKQAGFYPVLVILTGAYLATRLTLTALRLLVSSQGPGLRLTRFSNDTARYLHARLRGIVIVAIFGMALGDIAFYIGAAPDAVNAFSKLVALIAHLMLILMVIQQRKAVSAWIRESGEHEAPSALRSLVADIWAFVAILMIAALWVVWVLGVANGFSQLLHYAWQTALVVLVATGLAVVVLGALDRVFYGDQAAVRQEGAEPSPRPYYHKLVQRLAIAVVILIAMVALLEVWGINALSWFRAGSVGRSIASAATTIGIACVLAMLAWESANFAIKRRVERWTREGDLGRATRLRTLVPILRTTLFIVIALIVLLTTLNQLGINIAPLLAGASIIGVALGFGSQKLVQDFITGIFLLMENAMQVGDFVNLAGVSGTVEYLSIRTVRLRASDGSLHVIPFSSVSTVTNTNRGIGNAAIRVSVRADSDVDTVVDAIKSVGAEMRQDAKLGPLMLADLDLWGVDQIDGATMTFTGQIRCLDRGRWTVQRAFNRRILSRFRELGIQFANPQASFVTVKDDRKPQEQEAAVPPTTS